jgi:carboxyl-terminal processing protease
MVAALDDPYTNYYDPDLAEQWDTEMSGEYEGIGAWVEVETEYLTIISPIKNTPAEEAGLQPGDQIIAIDGDDMTGIDPNIVLKRVLGPAGTKVTLTILREGTEKPFEVEIIRRKIVIPYIEYEILPGNIAYLKLIRFYEGGDQEFRNALEELLSENPTGLIIDLRKNPGGFLHIVVNITSEFLTGGNVLIEEFSDGSRKTYPAITSRGIAPEIPLVVLVDEGSASASEIFAGAIQDYDRGIVIGTTTFGKGLVQLPITLPDDQGLVSITVARWLTPNEDTIHQIGIEPDIIIEPTEEELENELDPQLDEAVRILSSN